MGQLKNGIATLNREMVAIEANLKKLAALVKAHGDRVGEMAAKTNEGFDVLYLYLTTKFKKHGTSIDAEKGKKLTAIMDPNISQNLAGNEQWRKDLKASIVLANQQIDAAKMQLLSSINLGLNGAIILKGLAEKKKAKFFASPRYKDKIKTYLLSLDTILMVLKKQQAEVKATEFADFSVAGVDKNFALTKDNSVADVKTQASTSVKGELDQFNRARAQHEVVVRKFRTGGNTLPVQLANLKKWVDEADAMELEAK